MKSDIELHNGSPVYLQIHELLRAKIESGLYPAGSMIPSETELSAVYGVNRQTIHSALDGMVQEGLLRWVHGKGMFVSNGKIEQDLVELRGFTHVAQRNCRKPHTRILNQKIRPAGARYASIFNIDPSDDILYLRRLCLADGE
ncbi:MAG: GntR family transcriptional regulator, partial [Ruthenibacterium sp.]